MRFPKTLTYALASLAFTIPAAWLAVYGACIVWQGAPLCAWPGLYPLTAVLAALAVIAPIGLVYREKARRRASKGLWQKVKQGSGFGVSGWHATFERTVAVMWGSEAGQPELITGEMRYERRGWWLSVKSGRRVWVDRWDFWQWLARVEALAEVQGSGSGVQGVDPIPQTLNPKKEEPTGESPIGERRWQPVIGRDLWLAYMDILEEVGAVEYATDDLRSRRYRPGQPWGRVEEFEKVRGSEVR